MSSPLAAIPANSNVFIDTNIFIYGLTGQSAECLAFLDRCSHEEIFGICPFPVLGEATHAFMLAEARHKNLVPPGTNTPRYLKEHFQLITQLVDYWQNVVRVLDLNLLLAEETEPIVRGAQVERQGNQRLTTDSIIIASMRNYGVTNLASHDQDFDRVGGIQVFAPTDI